MSDRSSVMSQTVIVVLCHKSDRSSVMSQQE